MTGESALLLSWQRHGCGQSERQSAIDSELDHRLTSGEDGVCCRVLRAQAGVGTGLRQSSFGEDAGTLNGNSFTIRRHGDQFQTQVGG